MPKSPSKVNNSSNADVELESESELEKIPMDLLEAITKPVTEMTDDELTQAITIIRKMRKVRLGAKAQRSQLDKMLSALTPEKARLLLERIESSLGGESK